MAIILAILLQALVAPLVLIASVVLSFLCTLGISILFIRFVVGDAGIDASIPTFAFIFLVALGIDYTIFLMARVREEARSTARARGMLRAIAATGPVITSAGIILAGTFSVLMTLPVTFTFDLGFMVALGILLDTFIVRTIMVPAAVELIGDKIWWPSTARVGAGCSVRTPASTRLSPKPPSAPSSRACASRRRRRCPRGSPRSRSTTRAARSARSPAPASGGVGGERVDRLLVALIESGALAAISAASSTAADSISSSSTTSWTSPICSARSASRLRPVRKSSLVRGTPIVSMNRRSPVWP